MIRKSFGNGYKTVGRFERYEGNLNWKYTAREEEREARFGVKALLIRIANWASHRLQ